MVGRVVRPHPNKQVATIVDMCSNVKRMGRIETFEIVPNESNGLLRLKSDAGYLTGVELITGKDLEQPSTEIPATGATITFGKHKGQSITTVPLHYVRWASENMTGPWGERFKEELTRRG
jgi:hypothetical protein